MVTLREPRVRGISDGDTTMEEVLKDSESMKSNSKHLVIADGVRTDFSANQLRLPLSRIDEIIEERRMAGSAPLATLAAIKEAELELHESGKLVSLRQIREVAQGRGLHLP